MITFLVPAEMLAPTIEFGALAPVILLLAAATIGVLVEAFVPRQLRFVSQLTLVVASFVLAFAYLIVNWGNNVTGRLSMGSVMLDGPTYFQWAMLLVFGFLSMLVFAEREVNGGHSSFAASASSAPGSVDEAEATTARFEHTEVFVLGLFAVAGMMIFLASNDLIMMFIALEVFSLPLYLLSGMARKRRLLSQEAGLKYLLLGALASAFFLFGVALMYGYSGSFELSAIDASVGSPQFGRGMLLAGIVLLAIGLLFKIGAVPFHSWTPDVYMGAPTPVTGFMAIATKLAAVGALLRVFFVAFGGERWTWQPILAVIAVITMITGAVLALTQTDVKRMLAYSSIAHAGFILTAVVGASQNVPAGQATSVASVMFYMAAYGFATIGAFAIVTMVRNPAGEENSMAGWAGLAHKSPVLAGLFSLFLLSFAGIPLTGGFIGKWAVFAAAWRGGFWWLVIVAVLVSLVAAYFYIRLIVVMFSDSQLAETHVGQASALTWVPIVAGALGTLWLGLVPDQVMHLAALAGSFLR